MKRLAALCLALLALPLQAADFLPLDRAAARQLLDPASHRQPTVVALWSADCSHCKKNLQLLSALAKSNPRLKVITVAAEPAAAEHGPLIERYALPGPRYAYGSDSPEAIAYAIDPAWAGELPRTFLFNGSGGKEKRSGVLSAEAIAQATGLSF
jgi:thiol-disulfide isomerase/thioredoxin